LIIQCDTREQRYEHITKSFDEQGVKWFRSKLPVADYIDFNRPHIAVDRKMNLGELCTNICQQHDRFRAELLRAQDLEITLIFLVEHSRNIKTLSDVRHWVNPRLKISPCALSGMELYKRLCTIEIKYHTEFCFCTKEETGARIIQILSENKPKYVFGIERR